MNTKDKECKGSLKVSEDVISKIAATAASETEGAFCGEDNVFVRYSDDLNLSAYFNVHS